MNNDRAQEKAEFRRYVDLLGQQEVTRGMIADGFGVVVNTVDKWRLAGDPRQPPADWRVKLRQVAKDAILREARVQMSRANAISDVIAGLEESR